MLFAKSHITEMKIVEFRRSVFSIMFVSSISPFGNLLFGDEPYNHNLITCHRWRFIRYNERCKWIAFLLDVHH
jgi:hypothetical protein